MNVSSISIAKYFWNLQTKSLQQMSHRTKIINYTYYLISSNFFKILFFINVLHLDFLGLHLLMMKSKENWFHIFAPLKVNKLIPNFQVPAFGIWNIWEECVSQELIKALNLKSIFSSSGMSLFLESSMRIISFVLEISAVFNNLNLKSKLLVWH